MPPLHVVIEKKNTRLAIDGGEPVVGEPLPQWPPEWPSVSASVDRALSDGSWGRYDGRPLDEFIKTFSEFLGIEFVWPCSSGTIGVELALRGCGVTRDHEVILGGYDFPGNFRAIEAIGARPVLVDVRPGGYVLDEAWIDNVVNERTRAIIVSHLHGQLANLESIRERCRERDIAIVEDACQVPGGTVAGQPAGTLGDAGVFSFGGSKLLTAGRGGAIVTRHENILQRIRIASERGNNAWPLSALQAAALTPQIAMLADYNQRRLFAATRIRKDLAESRMLKLPYDDWNQAWQPAFYKFAVRVCDGFDRQRTIDALCGEGVPADSGFRGFIRRSARRCDKFGDLENAKAASEETILLHHPFLTGPPQLIANMIQAIRKVERCLTECQA